MQNISTGVQSISASEYGGYSAAMGVGFSENASQTIGQWTPAVLSIGFGTWGAFSPRTAPGSGRIVSSGPQGAMNGTAKPLTSLQRRLLEQLSSSESQLIVPKGTVSMNDLRNLTLHTGDEFAMLTRSGERLIFRGLGGADGTLPSIPQLSVDTAGRYAAQGWRFSGDTHTPGFQAIGSVGDKNVLRAFGQRQSGVWGSQWGSSPGRFFSQFSDEIDFRLFGRLQ